jgi:putative SbcD/Mre11-related phosphoesterase
MLVYEEWLLTPQRAAVHVPTGTVVIADLHLGYDEVRRRGGEAVPAFGVHDALSVLETLALQTGARRLIIAGDFCEDGRSPEAAIDYLGGLAKRRIELVGVVPGNHDKRFAKECLEWPTIPPGFRLGRWRVVHGDGTLPKGRVVHGHIHPCLRRRGISAPCYLVGKGRLVLPAFSPDAAGVNVLTEKTWRDYRCFVVDAVHVLDFGTIAAFERKKNKATR